MTRIAVLGADGVLGAALMRVHADRGVVLVPVHHAELAAGAPATWAQGADVAVLATGGRADDRHRLLEVVRASGVAAVDLGLDASHLEWVDSTRDRPGWPPIVVGAGMLGLAGDVLAAVAAAASPGATEVHVAYTLPDRAGYLAATTPGLRREVAASLRNGAPAVVGGERITEVPGSTRRLAWFPRPIGPAHAASVLATEPFTVPLHVTGVATVRTYLAVRGWRAERLQAAANVSRWRPVGRRIAAAVARPRPEPGPAQRATTRWACVAEAAGPAGVARAWAYGRDPRATAAAGVVRLAVELAGRRGQGSGGWAIGGGLRAPAEVVEPTSFLDALGAHTDLRWSLARP